MKEHKHTALSLKLREDNYSSFYTLLQKGFLVKVREGSSIQHLLCEQFRVDGGYLEDRIKTIFLDGKPVDNVETAIVKDGSTVALSAAMPGLAGATLRRGSILSSFRDGITYQEEFDMNESHEAGLVKIKLFNLLMAEMGPIFLEQGIWMNKDEFEGFLKERRKDLESIVSSVDINGREISLEELAAMHWHEGKEDVQLIVTV